MDLSLGHGRSGKITESKTFYKTEVKSSVFVFCFSQIRADFSSGNTNFSRWKMVGGISPYKVIKTR